MFFKRGKRRYHTSYTTKDLYKFYKENNPTNYVEYKTYLAVLKRYFDLIMPVVIEDGIELRFPRRLGHFRIVQKEYKLELNEDGEVDKRHLVVNYKKTKEMWLNKYPGKTTEEIKAIPDKTVVYYLNEHSDGKIYRYYWDKIISTASYKKNYKLIINRKWKKYLSDYSRYESPIYFKL